MPHPSGRPDRAALLALLRRTRTVEAAANELGVNRVTVSRWIAELRIGQEWVATEDETEGAKSAR